MKRNTKAYLFKSIHFINDDLIELRRPLSDLIAMILFAVLFLIFILITLDTIFVFTKNEESGVIYGFYALFFPEKLPLRYLIGEYYESVKFVGILFILFPTFIIWSLKFIPNFRPIRIDRKRSVIYFWSWGRFYIYRIPVLQNYQQVLPIYFCDKPSGCFIGLPSEDGKKIITRQIGLVTTLLEEEVAFKSFLNHYLRYQNSNALYQYKKEQFEYQQRKNNLFRKICQKGVYTFKYNEEKTEAAIQKWLATHNSTIRNEKQWQQIQTALEAKDKIRTMSYLILITILGSVMLLRLKNQL